MSALAPDPKLPVHVYYCKCGKAVEHAAHPDLVANNRAVKKDFKQAAEWGRKVEILTLEEFKTKPFLCISVSDCPDNK